jgi:hypothetical protein
MGSVKLVLANQTDKQAVLDWDEFLQSIKESTPIDLNETEDEKQARITRLEKPGNHEEWFKYYFPKFSFREPAAFHKKSSKVFLGAKRIYHSRKWARGLSKSTRRMFEVLYKKFAQKKKLNALLISKNEKNAIRLLAPYRGQLQANQRLINDYGIQRKIGKWKEEEFITRDGSSFRAVGIEQNPRGAKLDELRPNLIIFDDADDDEVVGNEDRLNKQWNWIEQAVIPTVDIAAEYWICFDNNIIGEDCLALRASEKSTYSETVNIRDEFGNSTWPEKNSESDIDDILSMISWASGQKEYFNNPLSQGKTFPEMKYGKCPPLKSLKFVIIYGDPSPSNKDKPSLKSKAHTSCKAVQVIGVLKGVFYVYKAYVDHAKNSTFIDWLYDARDYVGVKTTPYAWIENNSLQDPFFEQVLIPLIREKGKTARGGRMYVRGDEREKPDKWVRIESNLEPLNRLGKLVLNIDEKDDPHMQRLEAQFKNAKATSKILDGPDCTEGGIYKAKEQTALLEADKPMETVDTHNSKRY